MSDVSDSLSAAIGRYTAVHDAIRVESRRQAETRGAAGADTAPPAAPTTEAPGGAGAGKAASR